MRSRFCLIVLLFFPALCLGELETASDVDFGDGRYNGNFLRLVHQNAYVGGMVGNWRQNDDAASILTGLVVGFKSRGDLFFDMAIGSYEELTDPTLELQRYLPTMTPTMGTLTLGLRLTEAVTLGLGGMYLRQRDQHDERELGERDRLMGKASIQVDFR